MSYKDFTKMSVWQKSFDLLIKIYQLTKTFPKKEKFGMISDIRRAANSVVHNIAEGFGRYERKDKTRFYKISRGSSYEVISQALVSSALQYLDEKDKKEVISGYKQVIDELDSIIKSVELRDSPKPKPSLK
ncbi:MAG: four helix bundle protein [Bacteroidota bacterium]|nr:four helix bundle protein [Bacteroidota bacterium]